MSYTDFFKKAIVFHDRFDFRKSDDCLKEPLHIGYGIDENYARCMATSISSICKNNRETAIVFHVLAENLSGTVKNKLKQMAEKFAICIHLYDIDASVFKKLPTQVHFPPAIYYRYILPLVLEDVSHVLYLDADIVALKSLQSLQRMDMGGNIAAVVPDLEWMNKKRNKILDLKNHQYFNSGVLWIDVNRWNDFDVLEKSIDLLQKQPENLRYPDQDALNIILTGNIVYLGRLYNCIDISAVNSNDIVLLHFAAHPKPWNIAWPISKLCTDFTKDIYRQYEAMTPWQGSELQMPRNYKEMKVYAKCLWRNGKYADALLWQVKYIMKKLFH